MAVGPMKIAIVGAGAMGSVYAGLLGAAGNEVWVVDLWEEHINAIRENGLRVEGASGDRLVKELHASTDPAAVGACDLVIIATKAADVAQAAQSAKAMMHPDTIVLAMQNGLGSGERVRRYLPRQNVLLGVAKGFGASIRAPGHVHHNGMELIQIGEMEGGTTRRVSRIERFWREAGFNVKVYDDINLLIWEKFVCNVTFSGPCTVFGRTVRDVMDDPYSWKIALTCGLEAVTAGRAKGIPFSFDDAEAYITSFGRGVPDARPSMLLDHMARRRSEIDVINGMVPVVAAKVGTSAPYNEVISAIVRSREVEF